MMYPSILLVLLLACGVHSDCIKGYTQDREKCYRQPITKRSCIILKKSITLLFYVSGAVEFGTFAYASSICQKEGSNLASIRNLSEDSLLNNLAAEVKAFDYWIGLKCTNGNSNGCYWIDKTPFTYKNLFFGYPAALAHCGAVKLDSTILPTGKWYTTSCLTELRFVCEQPSFENSTTTEKPNNSEASNGEPMSSESMHPKNVKKLL